jgi:hypothetical protein
MEPAGINPRTTHDVATGAAQKGERHMGVLRLSRRRAGLALVSAAVVVAGGLGIAAASSSAPPSGAMSNGRGIPGYGMTHGYFKGVPVGFTYTKGFYCDTSVASTASSGCEAGANFKNPPAKDFDPLFITVPLGFSRPMDMIQCPAKLVCIDHPGTIDLTRLEPALKSLYPQLTDAQLTAALKNFATPEHDHFITTANWRKAEWWDVKVIGVTSGKTFDNIRQHKSYGYIQQLLKSGDKSVVGPIDTNLFLYFAAH